MDLVVLAIAGLIFFAMYRLLAKVAEEETYITPENYSNEELRSIIPEDSTLRRHFMTNLKMQVESELFPRPTCSTLKRHYDTHVLAEVEKRLFK